VVAHRNFRQHFLSARSRPRGAGSIEPPPLGRERDHNREAGILNSLWADRESRAALLLSLSTLSFLFAGAYKGMIASPVDLTLVTAAATLGLSLLFRTELSSVAGKPIVWLLAGLTAWFAIRLLPDLPRWGIQKLAETVFLGGPALLAGYLLSRSDKRIDILSSTLAYLCLPIAIYVVLAAAMGNPYSFSSVGSAGYQMTGAVLALGLIACAHQRRIWLFATALLGLMVTGNMSGALFGLCAVAVIWVMDMDWKVVGQQTLISAALIAAYWLLVAPPLFVMRLIWKLGALALQVARASHVAPEQSAAELDNVWLLGGYLNGLRTAMPEESQIYLVDASSADRVDYYRDALRAILEHPFFGQGYGAITYAGESYPHNALLEAFAEGGLLAFLLLSSIIAFSLLAAFRSRNTFVVGVVIVATMTMMVSGYWGGRSLLFALGVAAGATQLSQRRSWASSSAAAQ
jgi:O-antigen ligase